jgi:lipopolysaccharide transport system ATP-binding protein
MSDTAIRVENLGKRYVIGARQKQAATLRESLKNLVAAPFRYLHSTVRGPSEEEILWALRDVSFEIQQGEAIGVIGRNGAGKSTLLKILSRITEPTTGRVDIYGRVGSLLEVGTGFHPELTGRENVYMNGAILGMSRKEIERKFDEIVAFAEVEKFIDTPVKRYSSGMFVRLGFAVAAHLEPEILIVDEVLAVGDVAFQKKCLGKMGDVTREGRTVLGSLDEPRATSGDGSRRKRHRRVSVLRRGSRRRTPLGRRRRSPRQRHDSPAFRPRFEHQRRSQFGAG